jgi:TRAP-type mannitol/chloroaromatic compound transport system permease small subunit
MRRAIEAIDRINAFMGRISAWLLLVSVLVSAGNAVMRKAFAISSNSMLELQWHLAGAVVMIGAAWVMQENAHVRIEIISSRFSRRAQRGIELAGHILMLLPFAAIMLWFSWPYFARSFAQNEQSLNAGGLVVWPVRGVIVLGFAALTLQALSAIYRALYHPDANEMKSSPGDAES